MLETVFRLPHIEPQLPIVFPDGDSLTVVKGRCPECHRVIPTQDLRGDISYPVPGTVLVSGLGMCHPCKAVFPISCRMVQRDEGLCIEWQVDGQWWRKPVRLGGFFALVSRAMRALRRQ